MSRMHNQFKMQLYVPGEAATESYWYHGRGFSRVEYYMHHHEGYLNIRTSILFMKLLEICNLLIDLCNTTIYAFHHAHYYMHLVIYVYMCWRYVQIW